MLDRLRLKKSSKYQLKNDLPLTGMSTSSVSIERDIYPSRYDWNLLEGGKNDKHAVISSQPRFKLLLQK